MLSNLLGKMFLLAMIASASVVAYAAEVKKPLELKEENSFLSDMRSWVQESLHSVGDNRTRYVLRRIGCPTESAAEKKQAEAKKKGEDRTVSDDIAQCERTKKDFYCLATLSLVQDFRINENKYYYYCQKSTK